MSAPIVPRSKIGTAFQSPNWRYQAVFSPERFGFSAYCSKPSPNAGNLARLVSNGVTPVEVYQLPVYIQQLKQQLSAELYQILLDVWNRRYYQSRQRKITFNVSQRTGLLNWNMRKIEALNDDFLKRLIKHCYNLAGDEYITEAIKFVKNPSNDMTVRWINYSIYGGKTDKELALQWRKPIRFIEALRLTFFDYSGWPKDKLVQYSLIRQMVCNNELDDTDYHAFRRIYDLGELGLRSILGHQALSENERDTVKAYLAGAGVDNLMDQRFTITNLRESVSFNRSVAEYANIGLRKLEMEQKAAVMRLTAKRIEQELGINESETIFDEDRELMDNLNQMMAQDTHPKFPSFIELKEDDIQINRIN